MPAISAYSLSDTTTKLSPPAGLSDADKVGGLFITPATPTVGLGVAATAFADAVQLPASTPVKVDAADPPHAILDTGETHTLVVIWSGQGVK